MSAPVATVTGTFITPGGVVVAAGTINAKLYPTGVTGVDTATSTPYKYGLSTKATISNGQFNSFNLAQTQSLSHAEAYYLVRTLSTSPLQTWDSLWRLPQGSYASVDVNSMVTLSTTPIL